MRRKAAPQIVFDMQSQMRIEFAGEVIVAFCSNEERSEAEEECAERSHVIRLRTQGHALCVGGHDSVVPYGMLYVKQDWRSMLRRYKEAHNKGEERTCHSSYGIAIEETVGAGILFQVIFDFLAPAWQAAVDSWSEPICLTQG